MLKEQALEAKVLAGLTEALSGLDGFKLIGFWQPTAAGEIRGLEDYKPKALVEVTTAQVQQPTASVNEIEVPLAVVLTSRLELDTRGEDFVGYVERIRDLFETWMSLTYQQEFTALDTDKISIDGLSVDGGEPQFDIGAKNVKVRWDVTLSGSYK